MHSHSAGHAARNQRLHNALPRQVLRRQLLLSVASIALAHASLVSWLLLTVPCPGLAAQPGPLTGAEPLYTGTQGPASINVLYPESACTESGCSNRGCDKFSERLTALMTGLRPCVADPGSARKRSCYPVQKSCRQHAVRVPPLYMLGLLCTLPTRPVLMLRSTAKGAKASSCIAESVAGFSADLAICCSRSLSGRQETV